MPRELKEANITHVSYVDKGANNKQFFFTKSAKETPDFQKEVKLIVKEEEQQLVYGVVYEPEVEDSHGDYMTATEIEKAAHGFMKDARNIDTQHDFQSGVGEVVESYVAPADIDMDGQVIQKGSWVLVTKATDEIWKQIKDGSISGYSMAGTAETIQRSAVDSSDSHDEMKGFFHLLKNFFTGESIHKGVRDQYASNQQRRNVWAAWDAMEDEFYESLWSNTTPGAADFERLQIAAGEFQEIAAEIQSSGDIQKAMAERRRRQTR